MIIQHPDLGPRDSSEFVYKGDAELLFRPERTENADQKIFQLNNFIGLKTWGLKQNLNKKCFYQDKGQNNCAKSFINAVEFAIVNPMSVSEIFEVHRNLLLAIKNV